jgi:hypothetical protein
MSNRVTSYLKQCNVKAQNSSNNSCITTVLEVKQNLSGGSPLFYIGSDSLYHYLFYTYDKTTKISSKFRIKKEEFKLKYEEFNKNDSSITYNYPIYLSDL